MNLDNFSPTWLIAVSAGLALVPVLFALFTSYLKVSIVLGMLRSGFGTQGVPSNMVVMVMSLAVTLYIMAPVAQKSSKALSSVNLKSISKKNLLDAAAELKPALTPWRQFMRTHTGARELKVMGSIREEHIDNSSQQAENKAPADEPELTVLVPAFVLSELKEAFAMAFVLLLPFLVIDLIVSNILVGMGMFMVSPVMISLPLKLILFVSSDAWLLLTKGIVNSYSF